MHIAMFGGPVRACGPGSMEWEQGQSFSPALPPLSLCGQCQPRGLQVLTLRTWACTVVLLGATQISPLIFVRAECAWSQRHQKDTGKSLFFPSTFQCVPKMSDKNQRTHQDSLATFPLSLFYCLLCPSHPISHHHSPRAMFSGPGSSVTPHSFIDSSDDGSNWG